MSSKPTYASELRHLLARVKLWVYSHLSYQYGEEDKIRFFRFGIPLVLKRSERIESTEADALRFLNGVVPHLPIPKLLDSFQLDGQTYTLMTKLRGEPIRYAPELSPDELISVTANVAAVVDELWRIRQPSSLNGQIMVSASGHGLPHPAFFYERLNEPFKSMYELYRSLTVYNDIDTHPPEVLDPILEDEIVWVHSDLTMRNVLVEDGRFTGIIDWEDAGWLPRHWLLHKLRHPSPVCQGSWGRYWTFTHRFEPAVEAAYRASLTKDLLSFYI